MGSRHAFLENSLRAQEPIILFPDLVQIWLSLCYIADENPGARRCELRQPFCVVRLNDEATTEFVAVYLERRVIQNCLTEQRPKQVPGTVHKRMLCCSSLKNRLDEPV